MILYACNFDNDIETWKNLERDLTLCYNLFHGICDIHLPLKLGVSVTRGNNLLRPAAIQMLRNIFYTNRIVLAWNSLSDSVVLLHL